MNIGAYHCYHGSLLFLFAVSLGYLFLCPYTKVEESFAIQATYDLYYYGLGPAIRRVLLLLTTTATDDEDDWLPYDHLQYPGVVPRTFAGPSVLTSFTWVIAKVVGLLGIDLDQYPHILQFLMRLGLLLFILHAFHRLARSIQIKFGAHGGSSEYLSTWFLLICASQFHIPYYGSRTLPNTFALGLVAHAYTEWFYKKPYMACWILVVCATVIRCDVIILLATVGLSMLLRREMTLGGAIVTGISGGLSALLSTVPLDSILWVQKGRRSLLQSLVWPEGVVLFFNTIQNKSSEWGIMPWHWYFTRALPRSMVATLFLVPIACTTILDWLAWILSIVVLLISKKKKEKNSNDSIDNNYNFLTLPPLIHNIHNNSNIVPYLLPVLGFVILYSFLPHKEMRFIFPALPMFNVAAAIGLDRLYVFYCRWCPAKVYDYNKKKVVGSSTTAVVESAGKEMKKKNSRAISILSKLLFFGGILCILVTFLSSCLFGIISHYNYPGGVALSLLEPFVIASAAEDMTSSPHHQSSSIHICVDVASSMTGVTLFTQEKLKRSVLQRIGTHSKKGIEFIKEGYERENQLFLDDNNKLGGTNNYSPCNFLLSEDATIPGFEVIAIAKGDPTLDLYHRRIVTKNKIFAMRAIRQKEMI